MDEETRLLLSRLVRIGTVTDIKGCTVRVKYQDVGITSGWLYVLQRSGGSISVSGGGGHSHEIHDTYTGGGSSDAAGYHEHDGSVTGLWMPRINDTVLCLYLPAWNSDGFVLGRIEQ